MGRPNVNRDAARRLAHAGIAIFPADAKKRPLVKWGVRSTTDSALIDCYWSRFPDALPAIDLRKCGLIVLDGDRHGGADGVHALIDLLCQQTQYTAAPRVHTPRDGLHIYFRNPKGFGNARGSLPAGIDVRGAGGFTIAPYATLPDGLRYEVADSSPDLAMAFREKSIPFLFKAVVDLIETHPDIGVEQHQEAVPTRLINERRGLRYAEASLQKCAQELADAQASTRNNKCNSIAFHFGRMIAAGWIDRRKVEAWLTEAMRRNGYIKEHGGKAAVATIKSGVNAGLRKGPIILRERSNG